jgi:ferrochelatase
MTTPKKGLLLLNLGTPKSPSVRDVRDYLNEFLSDPYVIDLPYVFRKILVNGIILNIRPKKSAEAYAKVWTEEGSPLMIHTTALTEVVESMNPDLTVKMAMRYGEPSIAQALKKFKDEGIEELVFFPLYPQYSYAASESSIEQFKVQKNKFIPGVKTHIVEDFFSDSRFIAALADSMREAVARFKPDCLLLSYHGIPERQIAKINTPPEQCCAPGCCDQWNEKNIKCYRAQCYETSRLLKTALNPKDDQIVTAFQSRLGRTKWIEPYTDFVLKDFPKTGIKRIMVASPSFTSDCLETLEEIKLRYAELFKESGGVEFEYIPCLNSRETFAQFVSDRAKSELSS